MHPTLLDNLEGVGIIAAFLVFLYTLAVTTPPKDDKKKKKKKDA